MAELTSIEAGITIDGAIFPKNVFIYVPSSNGVRVLNRHKEIFLELSWRGSTIDGVAVDSRDALLDWIEENAFGAVGDSTVAWEDVTGKPTTFAPTIGTTATTAKAGNYTPPNVTTSANGLMLAADKVKLDGVSEGATANNTDANLLNRANHTGTQAFTTISGSATAAQIPNLAASKVNALTGLVAGANEPIVAGDTLLVALAKLQAQIDAIAV